MKIPKALISIIGLVLLLFSLNPQTGQAAEGQNQIVFHNLSEKNDVTFEVYDVTDKYLSLLQNGETIETAKDKLFELGVLAKKPGNPITTIKTAYDDSLQENGIARVMLQSNKTYLILEKSSENQTDKLVTMPIILTIPEEGFNKPYDLYGKPFTYSRNFSFKKISSEKTNGEQFLVDAKFILSKQINGKTFYLGEQALIGVQHWIEEKAEAKKFVSNANGEVAINIGLTTGEYFLEEIAAPEGYEITEQAKNIKVTIPNNFNQNVEIVVGEDGFVTDEARVENNPVKNLPSTSGEPGGYIDQIRTYARRVLPKTGEQTSNYIVIGAALVLFVGLLKVISIKRREKHD